MAPNLNFWDYHRILDAQTPDKIVPTIPADDYEARSRTGDPISSSEMHSRLWVLWSAFFKMPIGMNTTLHDILELPPNTPLQPEGSLRGATVKIQDEIGIHFLPMFWRGPLPHPIREGRRSPNTVYYLKVIANEELNRRFITFRSESTWISESSYTETVVSRRRAVTVIPYSLPTPNPEDDMVPDSTAWHVLNTFAELLMNPTPFHRETTDPHVQYADFISIPKLKPLMKQNVIAYEAMRSAHNALLDRQAGGRHDQLEADADVEENGNRALQEYERGICFACNERFPPGLHHRDPRNLLHQCGICQLAFHENCQLEGRRAIEPYEARGHQTWLCSSCKAGAPGFRPRSRRTNHQAQRRTQHAQSNADLRGPQCDFCGGLIRAAECSIPCHHQDCPKCSTRAVP